MIPGVTDLVELGRGSYGLAFRGTLVSQRRDVAVKVLQGTSLGGPAAARFATELGLVGTLAAHPHVVPVLGSGFADDGSPYVIAPYMRNGSLRERIAQHGPMESDEALSVLVKLAGALSSAHAIGLLHGSIHPGNVLLDDQGEPLLGDFAIARYALAAHNAGTVAYAAPEVVLGRDASPASDVYGLAATGHALVTGGPPFAAEPGEALVDHLKRVVTEAPEHIPGAPPEMVAVLRRAMSKAPAGRPEDAQQFGEALVAAQRRLGQPRTPLLVQAAATPSAPVREPDVAQPMSGAQPLASAAPIPAADRDAMAIIAAAMSAEAERARAAQDPTSAAAGGSPAASSSRRHTADQEPAREDSGARQRSRASLVAVFAATLLLGGAAAALAVVLLGRDARPVVEPDAAPTSQSAATTAVTTPATPEAPITALATPVPTASTDTTTPPPTEVVRPARLFTNDGTLRSAPVVSEANVLTRIQNRDGAPVEVIGTNESGWYRVRFEGVEGWLWGAFVVPNDPGFAAAVTVSDDPAVLRDRNGNIAALENPSGNKVLVTDQSGTLWQVLLPDGRIAYVDAASVQTVTA